MGKMIIHEFRPDVYPRKLWVCLNASSEELLSTFDFIPHSNGLSYAIENNKASTSSVVKKDGGFMGVLVFSSNRRLLDIEVISHESVHVSDYFFEELGMCSQSFSEQNEPYAYLVGWAAKCINEARLFRNGKFRNKKQPTTSAESLVENK